MCNESKTKSTVSTLNAPEAIGPYSQAIAVGDTLFCSGQIPLNPTTGALVEGGIAEQTKQVLANIDAVLSAAQFNVTDVVKTTCYLTDLADFTQFNELYGSFFVGKPARSTVQVVALPKGANVEVEVLAIRSGSNI